MAKQIAVIMCSLNADNQKKILQGLSDAAKETDSNLYIFTNYVGVRESEESVLNAYRITEVPDFSKFDGLIMAINTVHLPPAVDHIMNQIKETQIPVVSIDREFEGMSCVKFSSYEAQFEMVEHMILEHGHRDIYYVTGPITRNREADIRYQAYQDALAKHGIEFREDRVFAGGFTLITGIEAGEAFTKDGTCPKCIVCANDDMAQGVMEVLEKKGYSVPDDVVVTGFDNSEFSEICFPPLTTVDKSQYFVGQKAVHEVIALSEGQAPSTHTISCKLSVRGTCGCNKKKRIDVNSLKKKYTEQKAITDRMTDVVRNMMADLSGKNNTDAILDVIKKYTVQAEIGDFYLCLCERDKVFYVPEKNIGRNIDILPPNNQFTKTIGIPLAYENGEFSSYPYFDRGLVLPEECRTRDGGNVFVITACFFQKCFFGYCVAKNPSSIIENSLFYSWILNIGIALENVRSRMLLEDAIVKLNSMWSYDMLTKLYNRAGFYYEAKTMLDNMRFNNDKVFILFFDVDGLKTINDTMGHEAGDQLIQAMADCIRYNLKDNMLAMRYGGDEFALFGSFNERQEVDDLVNNIRTSIQTLNESNRYPFKLSTSIGGSGHWAKDISDLSVLIEKADQSMYEEKRRKKAERQNP